MIYMDYDLDYDLDCYMLYVIYRVTVGVNTQTKAWKAEGRKQKAETMYNIHMINENHELDRA